MSFNMCSTLLVLCLLLLRCYGYLLNNNDEYQVWVTTGDKSKLLLRESPISTTSSSNKHGYHVWVDRNKKDQIMEGFGAAMTDSSAYVIYHSPIRHKIMQELFGSGPGDLGVGYIRVPIGSSDLNAVDPHSYDDIPQGQTDYNMNNFSIDSDKAYIIPVLKEALSINPNLRILASPWSGPAWMKEPYGLFGGNLKADSNTLQAFALYLVKFIEAYQAEGIPITSLTVQNEPLLQRDDYPTMIIGLDLMKVFIKDHIGPLLKQRNLSTKLLVWDFNWSGDWYPEALVNDGAVKPYIDGIAWHGYDGRHDTPGKFQFLHPEFDEYMTEFSGGGWDDGIFSNQLVHFSRNIFIGQSLAWCKGIMLWNLALDENHGPRKNVGGCNVCRGVITVPSQSSRYEKWAEYYAMAHFSMFVKPGAQRVEVNHDFGWDDLSATAFMNPDGTTVVIVCNPNPHNSASFYIAIDAKYYQYDNLPPQSIATFVK